MPPLHFEVVFTAIPNEEKNALTTTADIEAHAPKSFTNVLSIKNKCNQPGFDVSIQFRQLNKLKRAQIRERTPSGRIKRIMKVLKTFLKSTQA